MVHLFLEDGSHKMFKGHEVRGVATIPLNADNANQETLYVWPGSLVGYFERPTMFKMLPFHRVKEIHFTRKAGEKWTGGL